MIHLDGKQRTRQSTREQIIGVALIGCSFRRKTTDTVQLSSWGGGLIRPLRRTPSEGRMHTHDTRQNRVRERYLIRRLWESCSRRESCSRVAVNRRCSRRGRESCSPWAWAWAWATVQIASNMLVPTRSNTRPTCSNTRSTGPPKLWPAGRVPPDSGHCIRNRRRSGRPCALLSRHTAK